VAIRVKKGGHSVPEEIIVRRYKKGMNNFFKLYMPITSNWAIYDNSNRNPVLIAKKKSGKNIDIIDKTSWQKILEIIK
jgi:predicted ABC-type ATPase